MTRPQLIAKLLKTWHLNVPERSLLVPPAIHYAEILAVIHDALEQEGSFAAAWGIRLEKSNNGAYRLHYLLYDTSLGDHALSVIGPTIPATTDHQNLDAAIKDLFRKLRITPDIDGIKILDIPADLM